MILIVDFGGQTTHLIGRRLRDMGINSEIVNPEEANKTLFSKKPRGIILLADRPRFTKKGLPHFPSHSLNVISLYSVSVMVGS